MWLTMMHFKTLFYLEKRKGIARIFRHFLLKEIKKILKLFSTPLKNIDDMEKL
jgi:hypothetical protein